jgi:hypothetical protein
MINNTAYLRRIPWIIPVGIAYGLALIFFSPWLFQRLDSQNELALVITNVVYYTIAYTAFGIVFRKWKELSISFSIDVVIVILYAYLFTEGSGIRWIFYYLVVPIPLTVFISLQAGWQKKSLLIYLGVLLGKIIFLQSFYVAAILNTDYFQNYLPSEIGERILQMISQVTAMVFYVIMICELLNFMRNDSKKSETLVLNLENEYNKTGAFIAFWIYKTGLLMIAIGAATYLKYILYSFNYAASQNVDYNSYMRISGALSIIGSIGLTLFGAWYLRRLLLEYFITYNIQSKFLYWLAIIPFFGFLSFLFMERNQVNQQNYKGKVTTIGNFAGSSTTAITIISLAPLILCLVLGLTGATPFVYISLAIVCLMVILMIFSRAGYYVSAIVIFLALVTVFVVAYLSKTIIEELSIYFFLLLIGLGQLVMFLPIYHFNKFFYIPAENPEPETDQPKDLFV